MHECYGIDIDDTELMQSRTWRWLRVRVLELVTRKGTRTHTAIQQVIRDKQGVSGESRSR